MRIKIINGPNLNMLGIREPLVYGDKTYKELEELIKQFCFVHNIDVTIIQSNHEGDLIDHIHHTHFDKFDGLIINPGAYTHYSYAIRDALHAIKPYKVEVHLSDIYHREDFRKTNVIHDVVDASIIGHGFNGYIEAIKLVQQKKNMDK